MKEEFIHKVEDLYKKVIPVEIRKMRTKEKLNLDSKNKKNHSIEKGNSNVEIKELWSWVKSLVRFQEATLNKSNLDLDTLKNNTTTSNNANASDIKKQEYEAICIKIMKENSLNNTKELKQFLDKSISNLVSNRKKVDKIKELLFKEPVSKDKIMTNIRTGKAEKN